MSEPGLSDMQKIKKSPARGGARNHGFLYVDVCDVVSHDKISLTNRFFYDILSIAIAGKDGGERFRPCLEFAIAVCLGDRSFVSLDRSPLFN